MWSVRLSVESPHAKSLASSLVSEEDVIVNENNFTFVLNESRAKDARAMDDPIVSMSPFLPARTGTAPLEVAAEIQSASSCKFIPQEIA